VIVLNKCFYQFSFILIVLLFNGCSHFQPADLPTESTEAPSHSAIWNSLDADHQADWFVLLNDGPSALDWRLRAIDTATESIDLQTFLWSFDIAGSMVLDHLMQAAERGVKVKLLIDDTFLADEDEILLELAHHRNIEYRVYNPFKRRFGGVVTRWVLNLGEFGRLNHRMHNKAMVIDNRVAIVGGRNLADEYFGLHGEANFRDMELMVGGPVVQIITRSFDEYWNDRWSIPIDKLSHVTTSPADLEAARHVRGQNEHLHVEVSHTEKLDQWKSLIQSSFQGRAELIVDKPPEKSPDDERDLPVQVADALADLFSNAQEEILIISAYLIPTERLESHIADAVERGVRVRILTNSIASNNHLAAHSAYRNHITTLLGHGAELHEVRVDAEDRRIYMLEPIQRKALALHAKALVIDSDKVFIGSANLDPRSLRINTEMGLLVTSPALNASIRQAVLPDFAPTNAWQLKYDSRGDLVWVSDDKILKVQPATSFMQRIEDWFFSHLPIEGTL
jgi:putative cardiolipin synthase